ncbi:hypothetical protein SUNI508_02681 [Seiridium unicorne]|uniref:Uncharacterized protein n=1 Tax=Seiridium unicorne TaxID=138068 RepID=A0ABR2VIJ4_9PEZI
MLSTTNTMDENSILKSIFLATALPLNIIINIASRLETYILQHLHLPFPPYFRMFPSIENLPGTYLLCYNPQVVGAWYLVWLAYILASRRTANDSGLLWEVLGPLARVNHVMNALVHAVHIWLIAAMFNAIVVRYLLERDPFMTILRLFVFASLQ